MKHTPGPWHIKYRVNIFGAHERLVASSGGYVTNADDGEHILENEANARLIAEAPALLKACGAALIYMESVVGYQEQIGGAISEDTLKVQAELQDVIEKATA